MTAPRKPLSDLLKAPLKTHLWRFGIVATIGLMTAGVLVLDRHAAVEAQLLKNPTQRAFEREAASWLANPREASVFERALAENRVRDVAVSDSLVLFTERDGSRLSTRLPDCGNACAGDLRGRLGELSVRNQFGLTQADIDPRSPSQKVMQGLDRAGNVLLSLSPVLLIIALLVMQSKGTLGIGRTRLAEKSDLKFDDVIGAAEAKRALLRVATFMRDPAHYASVGATAPRGVLMDGPPGTGKTLLAKALAGECGANFIAVDGSYFSSMFFGAGIGKVRELFARAREAAPCIVFIDEIDGIGRRSKGEANGGEQEQNRIINRLLVEMDGFAALDNVVVIGATNNIENIDPAMRRPGRFDLIVRTSLPTPPEREALFGLYLGKVKAAHAIDRGSLARTGAGMSPADIANCVNRAAAYAAEAGETEVGMERLYQSLEMHQLGGEVSSAKGLITPQTLRRVAFHESGHALVAHVLEMGTVERVSIEPRGPALGVTYIARHTEEPLYGEAELRARLAMMLAGREAELLTFGNTSSGAADDLKRASELATAMVGSYGFSQTFGLLSVAGVPKELVGPDVQKALLDEARRLLEEAQDTCRRVLNAKRDRLEALSEWLLKQETVSGAALTGVLSGSVPGVPLETTPETQETAQALRRLETA